MEWRDRRDTADDDASRFDCNAGQVFGLAQIKGSLRKFIVP